jgi:hypothetical protein
MRLFALLAVLSAAVFGSSAEAHQFQVVNGTPAYFKFNVRRAAQGVVQIKSMNDAGLVGRARHAHCFSVTAGPAGVSSNVSRVCSSIVGVANITVRSNNVESGWLRLVEIPSAQGQSQIIEVSLGFHNPLVAKVVKTSLNAGERTTISITGGIPPYSFGYSGESTGTVNAQNEFVTEPGVHGVSYVSVRDSARNSVPISFLVRGEVLGLSMDSKRWEVRYGRSWPASTPARESEGEWSFQFPDISEGRAVGYVTQSTNLGYLRANALIARFRIEMSSGAEFDHRTEEFNTSDFPSHVRFLLQRGASLTSNPHDRWWSNPIAIKLEHGEFVLRVPLTPDQWTNVYAQRGNADASSLKGFQLALDQIGQIGFTFGGGFFFGHGLRVKNGTAKFMLTGFEVEK